MPPSTDIDKLLAIYKRLPYNLKVITKKEKEILNTKRSLEGWVISGDKINFKKFNTSFGDINFVILPENRHVLKKNSIQEELKKVKKESKLLIGISPYGYLIEEMLLKKENLAQLFDILLGSGRGASFTFEYVKNHCVWVRPITKGKAIYIITITLLPNAEKLTPGKNVGVEKRLITDNITEDPIISSISNEERCN